jgi:hypothetical protein
MAALFDRLDQDDNGSLSREEFTAMLRRWRGLWVGHLAQWASHERGRGVHQSAGRCPWCGRTSDGVKPHGERSRPAGRRSEHDGGRSGDGRVRHDDGPGRDRDRRGPWS